MRKIIALSCVLLGFSGTAYAQTCQYIGTQMYCSNGLQSNQVGQFQYFNNGVTRQRVGNFDYYSQPTYTPPPVYVPPPLPQPYYTPRR